ncbi:hypothetical protein IJF86_00345 [Candidatus Saccharibacteria bacterium]|nr:hypothetical protein [Candidatus Saccharibacteria bacterium]
MKMFLDTSDMTAKLRLDDKSYEWAGGREMAEGLHRFIFEKLQENHADWRDLTEITFFSGPGSFTGLRIGAAVVNALASELDIPLFDQNGVRHQIILPNYGRPANISAPRK